MDNGTSPEVVAQFDAIARLPEAWDHNSRYHRLILRAAPGHCDLGLDLGCGTGALAERLLSRCDRVIGVDASPGMIARARERHPDPRLEFLVADAAEYLEGRGESYGLVTSVATFHHLDAPRVLAAARSRLAPGGVLLVLDLYRPRTALDYLASAAAAALGPVLRLARTGRLAEDEAAKEAWAGHARLDRYETLRDVRALARRALGPEARVRRLLLWRYALSYEAR